MKERNIPVGVASFELIRTLSDYYIDKTPFIEQLFRSGTHYFLSRPRRFGKSLLLDTMRELFEGNRELFEGLHIHDRWDWNHTYPVVRLSFGAGRFSRAGHLQSNVITQLELLEAEHGLTSAYITDGVNGPDRFAKLLFHIHASTGRRVAVLVDEYDKPILDAIGDPELAEDNRDYLEGLYGVIKDYGQQIRFAFLTGITMFSKLSLFSTLNNLTDISLSPRYAAICGYTEADLQETFAPELEGLQLDEIRRWYNGYSWRGPEKVYNPWAILSLFESREFKPHWSVTGMPSYLYKVMMQRQLTPLDVSGLKVQEGFVTTFDVERIGAEALLFQSGYLTITGEERQNFKTLYELDYPNLEVRASLNDGYLQYLFGAGREPAAARELADLLGKGDFAGFEAAVRSLFAGIPHQWHTHNEMARCEGWYSSVLYACLWSAEVHGRIRAEESGNRGRSDLVLLIGEKVIVIECKMLHDGAPEQKAAEAIAQIRERGYAEPYRDGACEIHLIGAVFDENTRSLSRMIVEYD